MDVSILYLYLLIMVVSVMTIHPFDITNGVLKMQGFQNFPATGCFSKRCFVICGCVNELTNDVVGYRIIPESCTVSDASSSNFLAPHP